MRLLVVSDRRSSADALCSALLRDAAVASCERCPDVESALGAVRRGTCEVVVLIGPEAVTGTAAVREAGPEVRIVLVGDELDTGVVADAVDAGADAVLSNEASFEDLRDAVVAGEAADRASASVVASVAEQLRRTRALAAGPPVELTPREHQVLGLLAQGVLVKDIARELGIQTETCRGYVKAMLMKLNARSQLQAVVIAGRLGLLDDEPSFG